MDEGLHRSVVELLGDMATLLLLTRHHVGRVGLHQVVAPGFRGDVLEDDLHAGPVVGAAQHGRGRPVQDGLSLDFEGDRLHSIVLTGRAVSARRLGAAARR